MRKLNKLFAMLVAMLGVGTLSAQTDVTSTYLTNADFSSTDGWTAYVSGQYRDYGQGNIGGALASYAASTTDATHLSSERFFGFQCRWNGNYASYNQETSAELPMGVYTLSFDVENVNGSTTAAAYNNLFYVKVGGNTITDPSTEWMNGKSSWTSHSITFTITEAAKATVSLGYGTGTNNFATANTPVLYVSHLKLEYKSFQDITPENPVDLTSMVSNAQAAWIGATELPNYDGIAMPAVYKGSDWTGDALSQTINGLPVGKYKMEAYCQAHSSWDTDAAAEGATGYTYLCANEYKLDVPIRNADGATTKLLHTFEDMNITDGTLKISVVNEKLAANWLQIYVKSLTFLGPDKALYEEAFNTKYASLSELNAEGVPEAFATKITNLKSEYDVDATNLTLTELEIANTAMDEVINNYDNVVAEYSNLNSLITTCNELTAISAELTTGASATYASAIQAAQTSADAATTATELTNAYNTLEAARRIYMQNAYPTSGNTLDFSYLLKGADWENNSGSFTAGGVAHEEKYAEKPWVGDVMWDEISGLANGMYNVEVHFSASAAEWNHTSTITDGDQNTSITVNNVVVPVGVYKRKGVEEATVVAFNDVMVKDGTMDFMISNTAEGANWLIVAHKSITMTGKIDNTALRNELTAKLTTANSIKDSDMNSTAKTNLTAAIDAADATSEDPDALDKMINDLTVAIAAAETSVVDYVKLNMYIGMTAVFTDVATYQTKYDNGEYTADDVETVRRELNVARYNAASEVFTNKVEVTGWTGDLANNQLNNQHWSGESKYYYDANSWTANYIGLKHTLSTTVTLPNGKYVLKAAGRSSSDATLRLNIKNGDTTLETVEYTGKGDTGYGIDTSGAANFSAEGTYANGNAGRGWEWEFAQFELDAETEVTLHVEVDYNSIQNRFGSFSDITLWMDDATYVTVYGKELDAPLAEAKTLVNTLPMGEAENTALADAIALGEGEISGPTALNAAVDALKTAVANANAWVTAYNEAKAPLVAALERFEADYNDGENGAKDHMAKSRWETVIAMVQAAAEAKDVTNSYEGFAAATENLVDALDAATVSVNEYAALDEAIKAATALANGINWGDEPFQRPESAKAGLNTESAQAVYDAAEAEGEALATVAEALNAAMDITLNVPEGVFYLNVASEGHTLLGKSVVATLGATGDNNPTGYGFSAATATANYRPKVFTFEQVEGNLYHISVEMETGTVYLTYGSLNGSAAGWATSQIQGTTDVEKAGTFKIEASPAVEGAFRIYNTVANDYIDCQNGGSLYTDDGIQSEDFAIADASTVSVDINIAAENMWSTCVLLFDVAELPEGLRAFKSSELAEGSQSLVLEEVYELEAYTPYILYAQEGYQGTLTGAVDFTDYKAVASDDIALKGAVEQQTITEGYILQNQGYGMKFYKILDATEFTIPVGKCWLEVNSFDAGTQAVTLKFKEGTTGIEGVALDVEVLNAADGIYTIDGKRVSDMQKGQIYVVGGKKTINR